MRLVPFLAANGRSSPQEARKRLPGAWAVACLVAAGCGDAAVLSSDRAAAPPHSSPRATVSLSPAISATLADLGVADAVVGRTPWCWAVPAEVPAVGSLLEIDYERLVATAPAAVLVQPGVAGVDPELGRLAESRGFQLAAWRLERLADVLELLEGLRDLPPVAGDERALARLALRQREIAELLAAEPPPAAPRILLLVSADPPTAAGRETFLDELLRAAGGRNALEGRNGYVGLSLEEIAALAPDTTLLLRDEPAGSAPAPPAALVEASRGAATAIACREAFLPSSLAPVAAAAIRSALPAPAGSESP
jgi:iron complex transport system substrate-binding protein